MSIAFINNNESGSSVRTKLNSAIDQLNSGSFDIVAATNNGNGTNFKVGDDAWIGDVNIGNTLQIKGQEDGTKGFIKFASGSNSAIVGGANDGYFQITGSLFISGTFGQSNINIVDYNQRGGAGYTGFLTVTNTAPGAVTPSKFFRLNVSGGLEIVDSTYQHTITTLSDSGNLVVSGSVAIGTVLSLTPQNPLPAASSVPYSFAVSASSPAKPYFSNGTSWNALY
jgi:hypothetical protein